MRFVPQSYALDGYWLIECSCARVTAPINLHFTPLYNKRALLNRKFHISQISHRVKNWYQNVTFGNVKLPYGQFDNFGGLKPVLKFHIFLIFNCEELVRIRAICEGLVRFFSDVKNWYSIFTNVKNQYQMLFQARSVVFLTRLCNFR